MKPGTYSVSITVDGQTQTRAIELRPDPMVVANSNSHPLTRN